MIPEEFDVTNLASYDFDSSLRENFFDISLAFHLLYPTQIVGYDVMTLTANALDNNSSVRVGESGKVFVISCSANFARELYIHPFYG